MPIQVVNLKEKASRINELHSYKRVATMNNYDFKLVKAHREFIWHAHPDTDEVFYALDGSFEIHLRDKILTMNPGDLVTIPKGVEHKPIFENPCTLMLIEPSGTVNTGNAGGQLTDSQIEDI